MNRRLFVLAAIAVAGMAALILTSGVFQSPDRLSAAWMQKKFSLSPDQARQAGDIDMQYERTCKQLCARIEESDRRLAKLLDASDRMTPEILSAIAESDRVRTACRTSMLEHFYQVAAILPASQRQQYLQTVYPLILHPEMMAARHSLDEH
jgi:hypothetical protein